MEVYEEKVKPPVGSQALAVMYWLLFRKLARII